MKLGVCLAGSKRDFSVSTTSAVVVIVDGGAFDRAVADDYVVDVVGVITASIGCFIVSNATIDLINWTAIWIGAG